MLPCLLLLAVLVVGGCRAITDLVPALATDPPPWSTRLAEHLECEGEPTGIGAGSDPQNGGGGAHGDTPEQALEVFVAGEARFYGFMPLDGWVVVDRTAHWALAAHLVEGRPRALASFSDAPSDDAQLGAWAQWQVAACDASEFAADAPLSLDAIIWSDDQGRVPTTRVLEAAGCSWRRLEVDGRAFVRDERGSFDQDRLLDTFGAAMPVPGDAEPTPYHEGERRIWFAADGRSAYVGTGDRAERWPRAVDDDTTVTDCN